MADNQRKPWDHTLKLWNDELFVSRCKRLLEERQMTARDCALEIGLVDDFLDRPVRVRSPEMILRIAQVLKVNPGYLFLVTDVE